MPHGLYNSRFLNSPDSSQAYKMDWSGSSSPQLNLRPYKSGPPMDLDSTHSPSSKGIEYSVCRPLQPKRRRSPLLCRRADETARSRANHRHSNESKSAFSKKKAYVLGLAYLSPR